MPGEDWGLPKAWVDPPDLKKPEGDPNARKIKRLGPHEDPLAFRNMERGPDGKLRARPIPQRKAAPAAAPRAPERKRR